MAAIFTIDYEPWFCFKEHSLFWSKNDPLVDEPTNYLLDLLRRHQVKAIFYVLGWLRDKDPVLFSKIENDGHVIGDHTYYHKLPPHPITERTDRRLFRAPRWEGEKRLYSGGFWLRSMPYRWLKKEVEKTGIFYIHPHDVLLEHPDCGNKIKTFERRFGLKTSRDKLERLVREVKFEDLREYLVDSVS